MSDDAVLPASDDEARLVEMRRQWDYDTEAWREIRKEGAKDIRYVAGDPWDDKDRKAREEAGRPCLSLDELGQYVNELINDIRQHKRAIQVTATGDGANDETAQLRADLIRQIEYRSNAQQAYTTMFENTVQRSYGFLRVKPRYVSAESFDQELLIEPIVNPDMVTPDSDALKPDLSDMTRCFIHEDWSKREFVRKWPDAEAVSWDPELVRSSHGWMGADRIRIAEYWTVETSEQTLRVGDRTRTAEVKKVVQRFTNGIEWLGEPVAWPGEAIPIVGCLGKVLYVTGDTGSERRVLSMIRLARDPYMLYCYYRTAQAELVGMTPKTPFVGYVGQFRTRAAEWGKVNHVPQAYLEADPTTEATGQTVLPLPQRQPYDPPIASLEMGAEAARRAIQAAIGASPLPTSAQRRNEKSGIALQQIEESSQRGSFHFVDHYEDAITRTGAILNDLLPYYYDTPRVVTTRKSDDTITQVRINDPAAEKPVMLQPAQHDVTLGTGPSFKSEREAGSAFVDTIVGSIQVIAGIIGPAKATELLGLSVKLKNLGPIGDQIVKLVSPPEPGDPKVAQQQLQQASQMIEQLTQHVNALSEALQTKQVETAGKAQIEQAQAAMQMELARLEAEHEAALAQMKLAHESALKSAEIESAERVAAANRDAQEHDARLKAETQLAVAELGAQVDREKLFQAERNRVGLGGGASGGPAPVSPVKTVIKKRITRGPGGEILGSEEEHSLVADGPPEPAPANRPLKTVVTKRLMRGEDGAVTGVDESQMQVPEAD